MTIETRPLYMNLVASVSSVYKALGFCCLGFQNSGCRNRKHTRAPIRVVLWGSGLGRFRGLAFRLCG